VTENFKWWNIPKY